MWKNARSCPKLELARSGNARFAPDLQIFPRSISDLPQFWAYLAHIWDLFAVSLAVPLMSAHLKSLGASHFMIGALGSLYPALQLISGPIVLRWPAHSFCRKPHNSAFRNIPSVLTICMRGEFWARGAREDNCGSKA
uniref:Uncharacterized protein n=1 Tax=Timema bartmani TaxID=61472 RepID=A0A7R9I477_9NEOP|nr:unnamed protein product [Timema bartmani]